MSNPNVPNFNPGSGARLATDRIDFQHHVDGYSFRHKASAIDLYPTVVINSVTYTDVQDAIAALSTIVAPSFTVPDATPTSKGIVQLSTNGDVGGTATLMRVTRLQGTALSTLPPTDGQVLTYEASSTSWKPKNSSSAFTAAGDLLGNNTSQTVVALQGRSVANIAPSNNMTLTWVSANNRWEPATSVPTGTGFATTTSGAFDSAATANIRYAGGKFQTDANVQWKNSTITGDLSWAPTSTNKTLVLPDANDTLVGQATTDTLTNKTINVNNNTLTATSTASGDLLVSNGTKFVRLGQGSNGSFLGVSGGVLGFYTPSNSTPSGTGFATVTSGVYDSTATANIRYTGGKLQTDASIQWNSAGTTGDLAWAPTSSNKILTLPDANDTLVGKATTDTLTNKTINVANNSLTATSQAAGDILKNNGSSYQRFAKGSALQVLRVNSGGTDLEWASVSSGGSSAGVVNTVQTSDGAGGFLGASNVLAGTNFISVGSTPSGTGFYRVPNGSSDTIIGAKDNAGSDIDVVARPAVNSFLFGNLTNQADVTLAGATTSIKASAMVKIYAPSDLTNPALTVSGAGTVTMNPHAQVGFQITTNVAATGALIQLWGGVSGAASTESKYIGFGNSANPPSGTPTGGGYLYVESGALKYKGTSGTLTTVGPADPHCKKCGRDFMHEWSNEQWGTLSTCMPCLLDALETLAINVNAFSTRDLSQ